MTNRRQTKEMYLTRWKWMILASCIIQVIIYPVEGVAKKRTKLQPRKDGDGNTTTSDPGLPPNTDSPTSPPDQGTTPDPDLPPNTDSPTSPPDQGTTPDPGPSSDATTVATTDATTEANPETTWNTTTDISNPTTATDSNIPLSTTESVPPSNPAPTPPPPKHNYLEKCDPCKKECNTNAFLRCMANKGERKQGTCLCLKGLMGPPGVTGDCAIPYDKPCPVKEKGQKSSTSRRQSDTARRPITDAACHPETECVEVNKNKFCRPSARSKYKSMIVSPNSAGAVKKTQSVRSHIHKADEYRLH